MNFSQAVLNLVKKIPRGKITTYKEIGRKLGRRGQVYRAVGRALNANKCPIVIPCHRVVKSDGSVGGYAYGVGRKINLLEKEGVEVKNKRVVYFEKRLFRFR